MNAEAAIWSALLVLLLLNMYGSAKVLSNSVCTTTQKVLQVLVIWALPGLGGMLVFFVLRSDQDTRRPTNRRAGDDGHDGMPGGIQ